MLDGKPLSLARNCHRIYGNCVNITAIQSQRLASVNSQSTLYGISLLSIGDSNGTDDSCIIYISSCTIDGQCESSCSSSYTSLAVHRQVVTVEAFRSKRAKCTLFLYNHILRHSLINICDVSNALNLGYLTIFLCRSSCVVYTTDGYVTVRDDFSNLTATDLNIAVCCQVVDVSTITNLHCRDGDILIVLILPCSHVDVCCTCAQLAGNLDLVSLVVLLKFELCYLRTLDHNEVNAVVAIAEFCICIDVLDFTLSTNREGLSNQSAWLVELCRVSCGISTQVYGAEITFVDDDLGIRQVEVHVCDVATSVLSLDGEGSSIVTGSLKLQDA